MDNENWKPVPGYEGFYSVSDRGRVRRDLTVTRAKAGHIMKLTVTRDGYLTVPLSREGRGRSFFVHRLVVAAHRGPFDRGLVVNHIDGDKQRNFIDNLEAITHQKNILHAFRVLGRRRPGEKLNTKNVVAMRERRAAGASCKELAGDYGVTYACVSSVCTGRTWKHAGGPLTAARALSQTQHAGVRANPPERVAAAAKRYHAGESTKAIARDFGVTPTTVRNWARGKTRATV